MEAHTLYEVNEYIKRVVALNFADAVWIECEINQYNETRGNAYIELIDKDPDNDEIRATGRATIWFKKLLFIKKKLGKLQDGILTDGVKVKIKCQIEFSERYGLSFNIIDIDLSYTLGMHEIKKPKNL